MSDTFRAFMLNDKGSPRGRFTTCALDDLDPGDVVVRVTYSDVNYKDALAATGQGRILRRASCIGGISLAGTVTASADARFSPGDEVIATGFDLGVAHHGGYAEYARVPGEWLTLLPRSMTSWEAMALGAAGFTAALAVIRMEQNGLTPGGGPVIVSGATGGVGLIAVAALARAGHQVVALTGKPEARAYLESLGATEVMSRQTLDVQNLKPLGTATWAGAVDNLGGDVLAWILSTAKLNAVVAAIGLTQSASLHTTVMPFILRGVCLLGINSSDSPSPELRREAWRRISTDLRPPTLHAIAETITFDTLPSVFERFMTGTMRGRIVVRIGGES